MDFKSPQLCQLSHRVVDVFECIYELFTLSLVMIKNHVYSVLADTDIVALPDKHAYLILLSPLEAGRDLRVFMYPFI